MAYQLDFLTGTYLFYRKLVDFLNFLIVVVVSLVYLYVKTHQIVHFKQLYLSKPVKKFEKLHEMPDLK